MCVRESLFLLKLKDWGLFRKGAVHPFLRPVLLYEWTWVYYLAIAGNLVGRIFWALTFLPMTFFTNIDYAQYVVLVSGSVEILRRALWAIFRLENETLNNYEGYREK